MYTEQIIKALSQGECPDLLFDNDEEFKPFDQYIYIYMLFKQNY